MAPLQGQIKISLGWAGVWEAVEVSGLHFRVGKQSTDFPVGGERVCLGVGGGGTSRDPKQPAILRAGWRLSKESNLAEVRVEVGYSGLKFSEIVQSKPFDDKDITKEVWCSTL